MAARELVAANESTIACACVYWETNARSTVAGLTVRMARCLLFTSRCGDVALHDSRETRHTLLSPKWAAAQSREKDSHLRDARSMLVHYGIVSKAIC